jgi:hypothetical protein
MAVFDRRAPKRKRRLLRRVKRWNRLHPRKAIEIPKGFRASTPRVGRHCKRLLLDAAKAWKLPQTGRFDEKMLWEITPFADKQVAIALREVGVTEKPKGSNSGPRVTVFQKATGALKLAWCASYQYWVAKTAGWLGSIPYAADVTNWLRAADNPKNKRVTRVRSRLKVRRGDRAIDNPDGGDEDHIWMVVRNYGVAHGMVGVGGNENDSVVRSLRPFWRAAAFVRLHEDPIEK